MLSTHTNPYPFRSHLSGPDEVPHRARTDSMKHLNNDLDIQAPSIWWNLRFLWQEDCRERDRLAQRRSQESALRDRKSTRLNSSHLGISYAVFCLKKKKKKK